MKTLQLIALWSSEVWFLCYMSTTLSVWYNWGQIFTSLIVTVFLTVARLDIV